jgi:hypothetical protein
VRIVKCNQQCQSSKSGLCIGIPCYLGKEVSIKIRKQKNKGDNKCMKS